MRTFRNWEKSDKQLKKKGRDEAVSQMQKAKKTRVSLAKAITAKMD